MHVAGGHGALDEVDLRVAHAVPVLWAVGAAQPPAPAADVALAFICA